MLVVLVTFPEILDTGVVCDSPFTKPEPVGAVQEYKVPDGTIPSWISFGVTAKGAPEQADVLSECMLASG